ncbi:MAG TPA: cytochrome c [Vicinamibacterales bacterium]|nr:cytochrome c [Vicinamibacterales bacterium]
MAGRAQRFSKVLVAASFALVGTAGLSVSGAAGQGPADRRSIKDGVYTEVQANRGEREYGRTCEHCHGAGLEGDAAKEIPPLVSDPFMRNWNGKSLKELFDLLSRSMPADNRGSLSARTYTDLIAYLLRANEAPAGSSALPDSPAGLEAISIEK